MNLAIILAVMSASLFALMQVERRTERFQSWLPAFNRLLAVAILTLAVIYFLNRFVLT